MRRNKPETMSDDKVSGLFVIKIRGRCLIKNKSQ